MYRNCCFNWGCSFSDLGHGEAKALVTGPSLLLEREHLDMGWVAVVENLPGNSSEFTAGEISARIWREKNALSISLAQKRGKWSPWLSHPADIENSSLSSELKDHLGIHLDEYVLLVL